ncbi:MAG TPA: ATP-binding protein [Patescibacteria group bacterium]|nr:ATP-binding protein [Patescibacteria group bacterium]
MANRASKKKIKKPRNYKRRRDMNKIIAFSEENLKSIFYVRRGETKYIGSRESTILEFKENFNFGSLGKYAKIMASFANTKGGYIVFGIKNSPREIIGINLTKFENIDIAKLTGSLNDIFSPAIEWDIRSHRWKSKDFGIIYTHESDEKPIIATKNYKDIIKEAEIYFRYYGRTETIKFSELKQIILERSDQEKRAWMEVFKEALEIGPKNVALLDTFKGKIQGLGKTVLIDEKLLPKLKFIKKGEFTEKKGELTLKLVGDLKTVPVGLLKERKVILGEDIYRYRASNVCKVVEKEIKKQFRVGSEHLKAWRVHKIRESGKPSKLPFRNEYCEYKEAERDYRYSKAWIDFLVEKYSDQKKYNELKRLPQNPRVK